MSDISLRTEGVAQRLAIETLQINSVLPQVGGTHPEDLFSNSLGIVSALSLIRDQGIAGRLENSFRALHRRNAGASPEVIYAAIDETIRMTKHSLAKQAVARTARTYGVRALQEPVAADLLPGLYPLIPTKVTDKDGHTPTRIDLQANGIRPNNPNVRYAITHVPAVQITLEQGLRKFDGLLGIS